MTQVLKSTEYLTACSGCYKEIKEPLVICSVCGCDVIPKEDYTCHECPNADKCFYAWDFYNTGGDCLQEK